MWSPSLCPSIKLKLEVFRERQCATLVQLVEKRLTMRTNLYRLKAELAQETQQLIRYEEKRINGILSEGA